MFIKITSETLNSKSGLDFEFPRVFFRFAIRIPRIRIRIPRVKEDAFNVRDTIVVSLVRLNDALYNRGRLCRQTLNASVLFTVFILKSS